MREPIIRNYKTKLPKFINHYKSVKIKERKKKAWNRIELNNKENLRQQLNKN